MANNHRTRIPLEDSEVITFICSRFAQTHKIAVKKALAYAADLWIVPTSPFQKPEAWSLFVSGPTHKTSVALLEIDPV